MQSVFLAPGRREFPAFKLELKKITTQTKSKKTVSWSRVSDTVAAPAKKPSEAGGHKWVKASKKHAKILKRKWEEPQARLPATFRRITNPDRSQELVLSQNSPREFLLSPQINEYLFN